MSSWNSEQLIWFLQCNICHVISFYSEPSHQWIKETPSPKNIFWLLPDKLPAEYQFKSVLMKTRLKRYYGIGLFKNRMRLLRKKNTSGSLILRWQTKGWGDSSISYIEKTWFWSLASHSTLRITGGGDLWAASWEQFHCNNTIYDPK